MWVCVCACVRVWLVYSSKKKGKKKVTDDMFTNRPNIHISKTQIKLKKKKRRLVFGWFFFFYYCGPLQAFFLGLGGGFQCVQKRKKQKTLKFQFYSSQMMKSWNKKQILYCTRSPPLTPINILYFLSETQIHRERKREREKKSLISFYSFCSSGRIFLEKILCFYPLEWFSMWSKKVLLPFTHLFCNNFFFFFAVII